MSCSLARTRNPTNLTDRAHVGMGRQDPLISVLNWENVGWSSLQSVFNSPGTTDC